MARFQGGRLDPAILGFGEALLLRFSTLGARVGGAACFLFNDCAFRLLARIERLLLLARGVRIALATAFGDGELVLERLVTLGTGALVARGLILNFALAPDLTAVGKPATDPRIAGASAFLVAGGGGGGPVGGFPLAGGLGIGNLCGGRGVDLITEEPVKADLLTSVVLGLCNPKMSRRSRPGAPTSDGAKILLASAGTGGGSGGSGTTLDLQLRNPWRLRAAVECAALLAAGALSGGIGVIGTEGRLGTSLVDCDFAGLRNLSGTRPSANTGLHSQVCSHFRNAQALLSMVVLFRR